MTPEELDAAYKDLDGAMDTLDWYLKDKKFLCGDEISIADLFIANEVNYDRAFFVCTSGVA